MFRWVTALAVPLSLCAFAPGSGTALKYATYLGGGGTDSATAIAVDGSGNAVVAGNTSSVNFTSTSIVAGGGRPGASSAMFVAKLDPGGTKVLWSTYIEAGSDALLTGLALDSGGNIFATGYTAVAGSWGPTVGAYAMPNAQGFVMKLDPGGTKVLWVSAIAAYPHALTLDSQGAIYVTGIADAGFQTTAGAAQISVRGSKDAFVLKLSADGGKALYSTFVGGSAEDGGRAIAVDRVGQAYITGDTASPDFPLANPAAFGRRIFYFGDWYGDAFVAKLDSAGSRVVFGTYLGGNAPDSGRAIAVDGDGNAYVAGGTESGDFPVSQDAYQSKYRGPAYDPVFPDFAGDAFAAKFSPTGTQLWATYLGGPDYDMAEAIAVDGAGNVYVAGSGGAGFPKTDDAIPNCRVGVGGPFIAQLDSSGARLQHATSIGGLGLDRLHAMALSQSGGVYVAGDTQSRVFFARPLTVRAVYAGGDSKAYAAMLDFSAAPGVAVGCAVNAASYRAGNVTSYPLGTVAPGEIIAIFGAGIGPEQAAAAGDAAQYPTDLGNTRVLFDGIPAPLYYAGRGQINAIVPYAVKPPATEMAVQHGGASDGPWVMPVAGAVPAIFAANSSGQGQGAVLNQDYTPNSKDNPAAAGSVVMVYMTGAGQLSPALPDGLRASTAAPPEQQPKPALSVSATVRGMDATVKYAGAAPGWVSGLIQVNVQIPEGVGFGNSVPLQIKVGNWTTQPNVTIAVK